MVGLALSVLFSLTATSRCLYAFSRDAGVLGAHLWRLVSPKTHVSARARLPLVSRAAAHSGAARRPAPLWRDGGDRLHTCACPQMPWPATVCAAVLVWVLSLPITLSSHLFVAISSAGVVCLLLSYATPMVLRRVFCSVPMPARFPPATQAPCTSPSSVLLAFARAGCAWRGRGTATAALCWCGACSTWAAPACRCLPSPWPGASSWWCSSSSHRSVASARLAPHASPPQS